MKSMPKFIKINQNKIHVIDKRYNFITSTSWLSHLDTLTAQDLISGINDIKTILKNTKPTTDRDLIYENHLLTTFSWKLNYKQQLTLF